jgi:phosphate transport system substrate-binding protein
MNKTILAAFLALTTAGAAIPAQSAHADELAGSVSLSGAWAIYPLAVKWGEAFQKLHPKVKFDISAGGAGKGMSDALSGAVDIGMVSRELDKSEKAKGASPIFIAKDGVFPIISIKNPAAKQILTKGITKQTFTDVYINGKTLTWRQVAGGPAAPVHAYTRSDACGAASAWASTLGKYKQDQLKGIGVYGDPGILQAVKNDPIGLGYNNLSYVFNGEQVSPGIYIVPIDANNNGKVDRDEWIPNRSTAFKEIASGKYPGARREFFVTKGKPNPVASEFIKFALSDQGTKILNQVGGYVPLSKSERKAQLSKLR